MASTGGMPTRQHLPAALTLAPATSVSSRSRPLPTSANCTPASAGTAAHSHLLAGEVLYSGQHSM